MGNCFACMSKNQKESFGKDSPPAPTYDDFPTAPGPSAGDRNTTGADSNNEATECGNNTTAKAFTFRELASATKNFRQECLLSETGGIGRLFKGTLQSNGQTVVVRQLDRNATQGTKEFQADVLALSQLQHPNLVKMIGYCADGDQRILVYEFLPLGTLESHLFDLSEDKKPLDWLARMKIALGIAEGLEYLHEKANPPIMYWSLKSSNILLDESDTSKLSEYGLARLLQSGNMMNSSTAYGHCGPEWEMQGEATAKSDVYSFGVILLELITGLRGYDDSRPDEEQSLVSWAKPFFSDPKRFPDMVDPCLGKDFPTTGLNQAVGVASMCTQEEPSVRPFISDVVAALTFLAMAPPKAPSRLTSVKSTRLAFENQSEG